MAWLRMGWLAVKGVGWPFVSLVLESATGGLGRGLFKAVAQRGWKREGRSMVGNGMVGNGKEGSDARTGSL